MEQEIKLPPLPEPDWYLVMSADGDNVNVELRASDEDAVNAALDMGGMVEIHRLITIDKAEAYATAAIEAYQAGRAALQSQDREDVKRIDFIEANPGWLRVYRLGHPTKQQWACVSPFTNYEFDGFKTAREAIDHARRIEGEL